MDRDSLTAVFNQIGHVDVDMVEVRDALHIPDDAGEHTDALEAVLRRIPNGWGRWISCDAGWYPLVVEADRRCAAVCEDYIVQQVKEKFGRLRYYCEPPRVGDLDCCTVFKNDHPVPLLAERDDAWDDWAAAYAEHEATDVAAHIAHGEARAAWRAQWDAINTITSEIEERSSHTCELDGAPGVLMRRWGRVKTLCEGCAADGWEPVS